MDLACPRFLRPHLARIEASPLGYRLAKGAFWSIVGTFISRAMGVLGSIIVARLLGITVFGEFTTIQSTVGLFGTFAGLGLGITATKYVAELRETQKERCGRVILLTLAIALTAGAVGSVTLVVGAPWLARRTLAAPHLSVVLQTSALLVLFSTLQSAYTGALAGFEAFKRTARVNCVGSLLGTPFLILGAWFWGVKGAVWGIGVQALVCCVVAHLALLEEANREHIPLPFGALLRPFKELNNELDVLWKFSLPAFLSSLLVGPVNWTCNTLLVNQPSGYSQAAVLSAANQWKNFIGFIPLMLGSVLVPMLANLHAAGRGADFVKLVKRQLFISSGLCLGMALPLMLVSSMLMRFYGRDFAAGAPVLILTLATTAIAATNNLLSKSMQSAGRAWLDLGFSGIWAVALVIGSLWLIPRHGAMGVAIAQAFAAGVLGLWQWHVLRRVLAAETVPTVRLNDRVLQS